MGAPREGKRRQGRFYIIAVVLEETSFSSPGEARGGHLTRTSQDEIIDATHLIVPYIHVPILNEGIFTLSDAVALTLGIHI